MHNAGGIRLSATPRTMLDISLILIADVIELYASIDFKSHLFSLHSTFLPPCSCVCHAESSIFDRLTECNLLLPYISTLHFAIEEFPTFLPFSLASYDKRMGKWLGNHSASKYLDFLKLYLFNFILSLSG